MISWPTGYWILQTPLRGALRSSGRCFGRLVRCKIRLVGTAVCLRMCCMP